MFTVKVDGDAEGGWMCEVHDGDTLTTYSPVAKDAVAAARAAIGLYVKDPETGPVPTPAA